MSLPNFSGRGFLITDGIDLKYSKGGTAYARLPLVFKKQHKDDRGTWVTDSEILIEGTVFGGLAESLKEVVAGRTEMYVTGELYTEEYEGKKYTKATIRSAWPVREDRPVAAAVGSGAGNEEFPF